MKKLLGLSILFVFAIFSTASVNAQEETGLFSGNGIKSLWTGDQSVTGARNTGTFGFYNGNASSSGQTLNDSGFQLPKWELPKLKLPKLHMPKILDLANKPRQLTNSGGNGLLANLPKLGLLSRDSNQPNFFQRMNERTKEIFGRTRQGINDTTNHVLGADQAARQTWDTITKGINGDIGGSGNRNQPPIQPNLRSAQADGSTTRY